MGQPVLEVLRTASGGVCAPKRAPCGCEKVGGGWNISECTCPAHRALLGPHYRWPKPAVTLESFAEGGDAARTPCGCVREGDRWDARGRGCPMRTCEPARG